jgi:hypothetical protein
MGNYPMAVAYFQAVQDSYADEDTMTEAHLEMAHAYSEAKMYPDAFQNYRSALNDLHFRISQYKKYGGDPEWLTWLAERLLDDPWLSEEATPEAPVMTQEADLPEEMEPLLERKRYTSPRLKALLGIRRGLEHVGVLRDKVADGVAPDPPIPPLTPVTYPPLHVMVPRMEPHLSGLLDLNFALLDTEYRLVHSGSMLGLLSQAERRAFLQDCLAFYRREFEALLLPHQAGEDAATALDQLRSTVRHLPLSLQEKETVLAKLLHMRRSLHEAEGTLERWASGIADVASSQIQPTRFQLLEDIKHT